MSLAPLILGYFSDSSQQPLVGTLTLLSLPWILAGVIKIAYDIILYGLYLCDNKLKHGEENAEAADRKEAVSGGVNVEPRLGPDHRPLLRPAANDQLESDFD